MRPTNVLLDLITQNLVFGSFSEETTLSGVINLCAQSRLISDAENVQLHNVLAHEGEFWAEVNVEDKKSNIVGFLTSEARKFDKSVNELVPILIKELRCQTDGYSICHAIDSSFTKGKMSMPEMYAIRLAVDEFGRRTGENKPGYWWARLELEPRIKFLTLLIKSYETN